MKNDMGSAEMRSPTQDCIDNGKHFLYLDMVEMEAPRALCREPFSAEMAAKILFATHICEDVDDRAGRRNEADAILFSSKGPLPSKITVNWLGDMAASELISWKS